MNGLASVNVELTSRCNKACWCCGRRKIEKERPDLAQWGDMEWSLVQRIAGQLPGGVTVQLHNNGEPLMYPRFGDAVKAFHQREDCLVSVDTNGKLLVEKGCEIVDNMDTLAISIIQNDPEADEQYEIIRRFLRLKGKFKPLVVLRLNGVDVDSSRYKDLGCIIATRVLHDPMGSFGYMRRVTVPEVGVCKDLLHRLSIDRRGNVSICVRFDPEGKGIIGNANTQTLEEIWWSDQRLHWISLHKQGERKAVPLCSMCEFWGLPTGW